MKPAAMGLWLHHALTAHGVRLAPTADRSGTARHRELGMNKAGNREVRAVASKARGRGCGISRRVS
jgi:hypothetical protein